VVRIGTSDEPVTVRLVTTLAPAIHLQFGWDNNFTGNPLVQPQDPALAGGGINQSLDFGDVLYGTSEADLLIGRLGQDVLLGNEGDDVLIGGLEHFHPQQSDRKFGGPGNDILIWGVGDGSDLLDGGPGQDVLILGLVGEVDEAGQTVFRLSDDEQTGEVFIDPTTQLPAVDVTNASGFCGVIDDSSDANAPAQFESLGVQQLVRFFLREQAAAFEGGEQSADNGLRQTMHLKDIEFLICPTRAGGAIEILDLTASPPAITDMTALALNQRLQLIVR
jgi:Ca2+-binding RTX toxin-like protein